MFKVTGAPGNAKVFRQIANIPQSMGRGLKKGGILAGKKIQTDIRADMAKKKSGRIYFLREFWLGQGFIKHRASAPGEAPARLTGSLKASVNYVPSATDMVVGAGTTGGGVPGQIDLGGQIGFGRVVDYARKLELGMNRPYLKKNIDLNHRNTQNYYIRETRRELNKL